MDRRCILLYNTTDGPYGIANMAGLSSEGVARRTFQSSLAKSIFGSGRSGGGRDRASSGSDDDDPLRGNTPAAKSDYYAMSHIAREEAGLSSPPRQAAESEGEDSTPADSDNDGASVASKIRAARRMKVNLKRKYDASSANRLRFGAGVNGATGTARRTHKRQHVAPPAAAAAAAATAGPPPPPPPRPPAQTTAGGSRPSIPPTVEFDIDTDVNEASTSAAAAAAAFAEALAGSSSAAAAAAPRAPSMRETLNNLARAPAPEPQRGAAASGSERKLSAEERMLFELNNPAGGSAAAGANALSTDAANANLALSFADGGEAPPDFVPFNAVAESYNSSDPVIRKKQKEDDKRCFFCLCKKANVIDSNPGFKKLTDEFMKYRSRPPDVLGEHLHKLYLSLFKGQVKTYAWPPDCILRHFFIYDPPQETVMPEHVVTLDRMLFTLKNKGLWVKDTARGGDPLLHGGNSKLFLTILKARRDTAR